MFQKKIFFERLVKLMQLTDCTQTELAEAIAISPANISLYINAMHAPNYKNFIRLIEYFHCSADYLIGLSESPNIKKNYKESLPFAESLRAIFRKNRLTLRKFLGKAQIAWIVCTSWLRGKTLPNLYHLEKTVKALNVSLDYFLGRE